MIRQPYSYLEFIKFIAEKANMPEKGEELVSFIHKRLKIVQNLSAGKSSYYVYYCMLNSIKFRNEDKSYTIYTTYALEAKLERLNILNRVEYPNIKSICTDL